MIPVSFNKDRFFYDVHSLVKAFYPREEVVCFVRGEKSLERGENGLALSVELNEAEGRIEVSLTTGSGERYTERVVCSLLSDGERASSIDTEPVFDDNGERLYNAKNALKRAIYRLFLKETGKGLPWGSLTGIRPTHIPKTLLLAGWDDGAILKEMADTFYVSDEKARLALEIARREEAILSGSDYQRGYSLYIGIPFCPTTCLYCSFPSYPLAAHESAVDDYISALIKEMDIATELFGDKPLFTVYIGGGTPTTLSPAQSERLLLAVRERFELSALKEFTVEAGRPDSLTPEKLRVLRENGVTRLSVNPQTMNDETLKLIGRRHTADDVRWAFYMAREAGDFKINMDLILGLPGEGASDVMGTLDEIEKLKPDDLTIHALALKRGSKLKELMEERRVAFPDFEDIEAASREAGRRARQMGLKPYYLYRQKNIAGNFENTGYAADGDEGLYNILINEDIHSIVALGAGAISKRVEGDLITRSENVRELSQYLERIDEMVERKRAHFNRARE